MTTEFLVGEIRETEHRGTDDLLSAGLGLAALRAAGNVTAFADPQAPTAAELRRRALQSNWKGIADLGPLGGYGEVYGAVPDVPGREYHAYMRVPDARYTHRVLAQIPDHFDAQARCLVVTASSGSRGVYGAIATAGAWALPRGCAVAYTDKGAGTGYFDCASGSGARLDGTRGSADDADLEFSPDVYTAEAGIAIKHAHSGDNPEGDWGRHVLQAAEFGLAMLERAFPAQAPFTPHNTRIIAVGLSNGGAAVLQAAGLDEAGWLDAAVAVAANVNVPGHGRPLYDYATEAGVLMPAALTAPQFDAIPFARTPGVVAGWQARGRQLHDAGLLRGADEHVRASEALQQLYEVGWSGAALATAVSTTAFDLWRAFAVTYSSAYLRAPVGAMPGGFRFVTQDSEAHARAPDAAERAAWWADAIGIPPGAGVFIEEPGLGTAPGADATLPGQQALRALWTSGNVESVRLRASVAAAQVRLPRAGLPLVVVHGAEDGLIPIAFSARPYVDWLRANGRDVTFWPVAHAQHFDSWLALPGFGDRYVPLLPYAYAALDRIWAQLVEGARPDMTAPTAQARGSGALRAAALGL